MKGLANKNLAAEATPFFLGAGAYRHHVPASVDTVISRGEFLTAYTPYQPEIAQGTLQMLFEFQTQVAKLYGCAVANASLYDGSTACWEAVAMATRVTRRKRAVLSGALHPHYAQVVKTMAQFTGDEIADSAPAIQPEADLSGLISRIDDETACVVVQYPDILGRPSDLTQIADAAHELSSRDACRQTPEVSEKVTYAPKKFVIVHFNRSISDGIIRNIRPVFALGIG